MYFGTDSVGLACGLEVGEEGEIGTKIYGLRAVYCVNYWYLLKQECFGRKVKSWNFIILSVRCFEAIQLEMLSKLLNIGEPEFQGKFQATDINLKVFTVRIII